MPFISEAASAFKSRFGFHDRSAQEPVQNTPDLLQSVTRVNSNFSLVATSGVRRIAQWEDDEEDGFAADSAPAPHAQVSDLSEDPSFWKDHNVQVIIRIRPLSSAEISVQGVNKCVRRENSQTLAWMGPPESRFTFDLVADESVSQEQLFKVAGLAMVENCMSGYNSCMFAYGQTGSGKTHTMLGDIEGGTGRHSVNCGMTPRVFNHLFSRIQKEKDARKDEKLKYVCKCSFLEIYNEQILDLLDPSTSNLQIREDVKKGVYVENLKEIEVTSAREVVHQLIEGAANRKVASTNMNRASSRSHSVFTCIIESKWESQGVTHHRFSRLNLVDLAGSERQKSSGAEGDRLKEATNINKSLSTLGLVIMNLVSISNGKSHHVPYRDSKLTFLLQDSLGGNAKTIIIANVSPSQCCSMETLSTLKFAQRAKFIKNNAIVNEDASGDVIAMRIQIQQLKKEVSRLRSLGNGGAENLDDDAPAPSFLGSPGSMNWEGLNGSFTPLVTEKKMSKKKDYEVALVGAFRRENDKGLAIKALTEENQAAMLLAKQREDEIQCLKMTLRFREAGIKRLEAVASGKISAETHLLKEKEEHLKVVEVLRTQVDRNQDVTRFAMENLRLKEEIRRLKSFYEEGEREMMNEQIMVLQNKLLEALDWKLMNESDSMAVQEKANADAERAAQGNRLSSQEMESTWRSLISEENEFLRMQAIQNQAETSTLHKQLDFCLEERERLERRVNDLLKKLEESSRPAKEEGHQVELPVMTTDFPVINHSDQMDIKTMVDAIGAASEREAEAHEKAVILSKENDELKLRLEAFIEANDELQSKVKALIDEKNSLLEMYERAASESSYKKMNKGASSEQDDMEVDDDEELTSVKETEMKPVVNTLKMQLMEMHEENEKLMGLYEKAMHERDEFKKMVASGEKSRGESREELECPEKLVEVAVRECLQSSPVSPTYFDAKFRTEETDLNDGEKIVEANSSISDGENFDLHNRASLSNVYQADPGNEIHAGTFTVLGADFSNLSDLSLARTKLEKVNEKLSDSTKSLVVFGSLERAFVEFDKLLKEILAMEEGIWAKQQELMSHEVLFSEMQDRKTLLEKKLCALRYSASCFSSSFAYFEQREARAKARLDASMSYLNQNKQQLVHLQQCREETEAAQKSVQQSELELRNSLTHLKTRYDEENRQSENEKVLFSSENIEKVDMPNRNWVSGGKATKLLKSEEEKTKLQNEMKLSRDKLGLVKKELQDLTKRLEKAESEVLAVQLDVKKGSTTVQDMELALKGVIKEKEALLEVRENGMSEIQSMILDYQQHIFEADLKEMETKMLQEELLSEMRRTEALRTDRVVAAEKITKLMEDSNSHLLSTKLEEELQDVQDSVLDVRTLLGACSC